MRTARGGAAAKAGHDLVIEVTAWSATVEVGEDSRPVGIELQADAGSLRVLQGTGGLMELTEDDKAEIERTIDEEVLMRKPIEFRSTAIEPAAGDRLRVAGALELAGSEHRIEFELRFADAGTIAANATIKQTDWGIKPYTGLFGALKVKDEVEVVADGSAGAAQA